MKGRKKEKNIKLHVITIHISKESQKARKSQEAIKAYR